MRPAKGVICLNLVGMKLWGILFLVLPILGCVYVGWHVWRILPLDAALKWGIIAVMVLCFLCLFVNFLVGGDRMPMRLATVVYEIGTSSLFILLYLVMLFLLLDIGRVVHLVPGSFLNSSIGGSLAVTAVMLAVFIDGHIHYYNKVRQPMVLKTEKPLTRPLTIVMISDMHLGYHNSRADLARWVDLMNAEKPDLILIAGDIVDVSVRPLIAENMAAEFRRLQAPVYACLGNHDYYAGEPRSEKFIADSGIKLLRDSSVTLFGELTVIGRDDRTNRARKDLSQIVGKADLTKFAILLDHQPYHLEQAQEAGIDFQFGGHTHYGQVWPVSWIEDAIYEDAFGPLQKGHTQYYVSSGIGIWGGKFRIGTRSEYVVLTLTH